MVGIKPTTFQSRDIIHLDLSFAVGGQQPQKINDGEEDDETNVDLCPAVGQAPFRAAAV